MHICKSEDTPQAMENKNADVIQPVRMKNWGDFEKRR